MSDIPEAKSLRWLAMQFPYIDTPCDDCDRLSNCIHLYASRGADCIDRLYFELVSLRSQTEVNTYDL